MKEIGNIVIEWKIQKKIQIEVIKIKNTIPKMKKIVMKLRTNQTQQKICKLEKATDTTQNKEEEKLKK